MNIPIEGRPNTDISADEVLLGIDGNAFSIIGNVKRALRRNGASSEYIEAYVKEATSGDYDHLLAASVEYLEA